MSPDESAMRAQRLRELHTELVEQRFTGRSTNRAATAVVDGNGRLVDLDIDDAALRGGKPQTVGPAVLAAIADARSSAAATSQQRIHEVLGLTAEQPPAAPAATRPAETRPAARPRRPRPVDDDEDFGDMSIMVTR